MEADWPDAAQVDAVEAAEGEGPPETFPFGLQARPAGDQGRGGW
ncbi:hypothetical protein [Azospirillum thermophilum]